jgi:hypothetical protein
MKTSSLREEQIAYVLRQVEGGSPAADVSPDWRQGRP